MLLLLMFLLMLALLYKMTMLVHNLLKTPEEKLLDSLQKKETMAERMVNLSQMIPRPTLRKCSTSSENMK
ncbi:gp30.5 protein [Escherichia phage K1E]|uniref:Gp30.5 protein n=1 Tax=Escherichia phage K1E TaxID=344022 RepID=Q2WC44_BPK1E|nr:hypothetical protein PK1Ep42 [Escherichia phage K1E]CAJ29439.1 gp30.5 protein [Escherichia phage K1E]